ncbi:hypothetical protein PsorP6_007619 [Peronosclerospora sorghi]|uniref:Uncharacterized protein n=1 Tax=Peronosclerospora sorghi TaxID=230839 RepID=A0ACC0W9X5_9STRA|nr:hypothetical protein PsorP6_007619 [Peronosclerospora sorghi]
MSSPDTFKVLATEIEAIVHNGADVNLVKPYAALKSVNVLGTQKVLRLAVTNVLAKTRVNPVHYISTVDAQQQGHGAAAPGVQSNNITVAANDTAVGGTTGSLCEKMPLTEPPPALGF